MSQTLLKRAESGNHSDEARAGFHAELPGLDLSTLLQMACTGSERLCVEVRSGDERGHIYMADGVLVHASVGTTIGEAAVGLMLKWRGGSFAACDRPWPLRASIDASLEAVLLRAAQAEDEAAARPSEVALRAAASRGPSAFAPAHPQEAPAAPAEAGRAAAPSAPPPARGEGPVIASVRIDMNGEIVARNGSAEALAPLVGYVTRMGALLGLQLGLEPFEALAADLGKKRALVFVEGDEMVGLLLPPGALHHELRQQLGL